MNVFLTGGTGYLGRPLIEELLRRGHGVDALVRPNSERKLPPGATPIHGDALSSETYQAYLRPEHTVVSLVGVPRPSPAKAKLFQQIDGVAGLESVRAAQRAGIRHFVYVSVAQPAPIMKAYVAVRRQVEERLRESGLAATVLRPWYVIGPGHWWPCLLWPIYWVLESQNATQETAQRLGLVTLGQMIRTLIAVIEQPPDRGVQFLNVPDIRRWGARELSSEQR